MRSNDMRKILSLLLAVLLLISLIGCSDAPVDETDGTASGTTTTTADGEADTSSTDASGESTDPSASGNTASGNNNKTTNKPGNTTKVPTTTTTTTKKQVSADYYTHSQGKDFQNMTITYAATGETRKLSDEYSLMELGNMQLENYPIDGVYDQAFNVIKVGNTYKMWWCRACPMDTIWYAESTDMKNWYNAQCILDVKDMRSTYLKAMMSWPSVLYVDGKYHMFFEAPAELGSKTEYSNNILYATSSNGTDWTMYPNNKDPKPVIYNPNVREGVYGIGQPKAFYKDGYFYVVYTDATNGGGDIRVARSKGNGHSFEGTVATHTKILSGVPGAAVRYNSATDSYFLVATASENQTDGNYNDNLYMMESKDLYNWPYNTRAKFLMKGTRITALKEVTKKANPDFVTNEHGIVTGESMIFVNMDGVMPSANEDHRNTHTTWDGRLSIITVGSQNGKTPTLPNGKSATAANLKWYADLTAKWTRPTAAAAKATVKVDGTKDAAYGSSAVKVETVTWADQDSKPTDTTAVLNCAWDAEALYVYAEVKDKTPMKDESGDLWRSDGVTLYVDVPNTGAGLNKSADTTANTYRIQLTASGKWEAADGKGSDITAKLSGTQIKTKAVSGGYVIEAKIPWYAAVKGQVASGKSIALDVCVFDNFGTNAAREARVFWSDYAGESESDLARYGQLKLS